MMQGVGMGRPKSAWLDLPPRMSARRLASGKVLFYYQQAGKKIPLGANIVEARQQWAQLESGSQRALFPHIAAEYRKAVFPGLAFSTKAHYETALTTLEGTFGKLTLEQIEPYHVKLYLRQRTKKGAALFEKRVLSAMFNWAREARLTKASNPCHGMKFSKGEKKAIGRLGRRDVYVTDAEFYAVFAAGDAILQDAMELALFTGQRPGDILNSRRQDIRDGALWFVQEKTGKRLGIKVEGEFKGVLERVLARPRKVPSMYLICDQRGQRLLYNALNKRFLAARGEATWQFRDIRAKAATDSPDLKHAQELLGHVNETTTVVYRRSRGDAVAPLKRGI